MSGPFPGGYFPSGYFAPTYFPGTGPGESGGGGGSGSTLSVAPAGSGSTLGGGPGEFQPVALDDLVEELAQRLGDSTARIWQATELKAYLQEGYDALTFASGCLWATDVLPDYASAFNYTSAFEAAYFVGGDRISGLAQFTAEFERDFISGADGPASHSFHWEYNGGYVSIAPVSAIGDLPEDLFAIERATWNTHKLTSIRSRELESSDTQYELITGPVEAYAQDKDGLRRLRKWRVPSTPYEPYTMDDDSSEWGVLIQIEDITEVTPEGAWGDLVSLPGEHVMGDPIGVVTGVYKETACLRMEYRRRGLPLSQTQDFEIPVRATNYVRHYAEARALEREGPGQDLELAAHYQARYEAGLARMLRRRQALAFQRHFVIGGSPKRTTRGRVRLPSNYGQVVR